MATVGIIVNPWAGKDVRRLHAPVGQTSDAAKVGSVHRIAAGALDAGAERVAVLRDAGRIAERALARVAGGELIDGEGTGSALDTRRGATQLAAMGCVPIVVLGGDGTCRDVAIGAPQAVIIPISTGTNNVFPAFIDGSSAGTAAGLLARGALDPHAVGRRGQGVARRRPRGGRHDSHDIALVDLALIDGSGVGARAVVRASAVKLVVAAIASAMSTGLSAIAGRLHPIDRHVPGAVVVRTGPHGRTIGVPIVPGFDQDVAVQSVDVLPEGGCLRFAGPGVLAFDGERERVIRDGDVVTVTVRTDGPLVIDVARALQCAVRRRLFDVPTVFDVPAGEAHHGD